MSIHASSVTASSVAAPEFTPLPPGDRRISPTDVAQFIRLDQCERYLRLRLHQSVHGSSFLRDYGVVPQSIPPLLTRSGEQFERRVEAAAAIRFPMLNLARDTTRQKRAPDDERVVALVGELAPGATLLLFQVRLHVSVAGWQMRGDIDLLRLQRDAQGALHALIADMKSSTTAKVEHRLQVAFYHEMLAALFTEAGIPHAPIALGILYRGADSAEEATGDAMDAALLAQRDAAQRYFGVSDAFLEIIADADNYLGAVRDLVTDPQSTANRVSDAGFTALPYHLNFKCDGCLFNELCMKWSAEHDDLTLLPHLSPNDKSALRRHGVETTRALAALKELAPGTAGARSGPSSDLVTPPAHEALVRRLSTTWPVGPRLDELVHRARRYRRWKGDPLDALSYIPSKGYGSLPYCDATHNPNLVRVYLDVQNDYLHDRLYLVGALVVASEDGVEGPDRRRSIVRMTDGPPDTLGRERELLIPWIRETLAAIVELAAPDAEGRKRAPVHVIFFDTLEQRLLLNALSRHMAQIAEVTPLYDFVTQLAAFDSPIVSHLNDEIRELKNYPMLCQSLQAVSAYLKFDWNMDQPYRQVFYTRVFDWWRKLPQPGVGEEAWPWYTARARFNTQIPLEYAYAAWNELEPSPGARDDFHAYRGATPALLAGFQARRLEAIEWVTKDFNGNAQTEKSLFDLPDLATFQDKARSLAHALDEFLTLERHVDLAAWKRVRLAPPERRVLSGDTLIVRYDEDDQEPGIAAQNREHAALQELKERMLAEARGASPDTPAAGLSSEQRKQVQWSHDGLRFRLRLDLSGVDCDLDEALGLSTLRPGDRVVLCPRLSYDSRLPKEQRVPFTPTPKQMLYGQRADIVELDVRRNAAGRAVEAWADIRMADAHGARDSRGFIFGGWDLPLVDGQRYTLDADPTDWQGYHCAKITEGLCADETNTLYERLNGVVPAIIASPEAEAAQSRFLEGLDVLYAAGALHDFEPSKRAYIGEHGDAPLLLVQGPPGTGKSYATGFAVFARLQAAMAAGRDARFVVSCKTHAATDVLLRSIAQVQLRLAQYQRAYPDIFGVYFDARLLDVPLYRFPARESIADGVVSLPRKDERRKGTPQAVEMLASHPWCVLAATPGGVYRMIADRWAASRLFDHAVCDYLVLDEASQMNLPEAVMAALLLKPDGKVIVVGDHRQMPPIVKHDWENEPRRTFQEFRSYESLFVALLALHPPMIQFEESFRLHADMAEFLRREVYAQDGIRYHSHSHEMLPQARYADPFVAAVLAPEHPIVVVVHDEMSSQLANPFERHLLSPVLDALAAPHLLGLLNAEGVVREGVGVVVPHRAQRAAIQDSMRALSILDPQTGAVRLSAVDTVERFQGDERVAILVSATESDPQYLLASSEFLLDPRRLTVALSRAKRKMVLVASVSVFSLFSTDESVFESSQLWKNLLRRTCTFKLWEGQRDGHHVTVWGN